MKALEFLLWAEIVLAALALAVVGIRSFGSNAARLRLHKIASAIMHPQRIFY